MKDYLAEIKAEKPGARSEVFDAWIVSDSASSRSNSQRPIAPTGTATSWRRSEGECRSKRTAMEPATRATADLPIHGLACDEE